MSDYNKWLTEIRLRPSRLLLIVLSTVHIGALAIVLLMPLKGWIIGLLAFLVVLSLAHATYFHVHRNRPDAIVMLKTTAGGLEIGTRGGVWSKVAILGSTFVSPWLAVLHLRQDGRKRPLYVLLLPDMLTLEEFRRFRVWLRWADVLAHGKRVDAVL